MRRVRLAWRKASKSAMRAGSLSRSDAPSGSKMRSSRPGWASSRSIAPWNPALVSNRSYVASSITASLGIDSRAAATRRLVVRAPPGQVQIPLPPARPPARAIDALRLGVQADHAAPKAPCAARPEHHVRLGRAEIFAEEARDIAARPADALERGRGEGDHPGGDARRLARRREARVAIAGVGQPALVQPIQERRAELGAARRAKADRAGEARLERHAVVAPARRQIEQVARVGGIHRSAAAAGDGPAPATGAL